MVHISKHRYTNIAECSRRLVYICCPPRLLFAQFVKKCSLEKRISRKNMADAEKMKYRLHAWIIIIPIMHSVGCLISGSVATSL